MSLDWKAKSSGGSLIYLVSTTVAFRHVISRNRNFSWLKSLSLCRLGHDDSHALVRLVTDGLRYTQAQNTFFLLFILRPGQPF